MSAAAEREFLAADAYPHWRRYVKAAEESVRIYSPYLDDLAVRLLSNSDLGPESLSILTDLSPESGTLTYRRQLLAIRRLVNQDIEVRTLARLHAKVLLVDGEAVTVGSQNFTSYARMSRETTAVPALDMSESRFVEALQRWWNSAEPVDLELIERLLNELAEPFEAAKAAIEALTTAYGEALAEHRKKQRQAAQRRFERDLARARSSSTSTGIRQAAAASRYAAGQSVAYAQLEWLDAGYRTLMRSTNEVDLTNWRGRSTGGAADTVRLAPLTFYPVLLGPDGRMAFVRVAKSRITYVWRGVRWGAARRIGDRLVHERASFPDDQPDGTNLVLTFGWDHGAPSGYQLRLRFDGATVLPVADGHLVGDPRRGEALAELIEDAYEDEKSWNAVLRDIFAPAHNPSGFIRDKNAALFFPSGWLRIDHTKFLDQSVLLIQPHQ